MAPMSDPTEILQRVENMLDVYAIAISEHKKPMHKEDYLKCNLCSDLRQEILDKLRATLADTAPETPYSIEGLLAERNHYRQAYFDALADARRWQFVRSRLRVRSSQCLDGEYRATLGIMPGRSVLPEGTPTDYAYTDDELDAAIDAAMAATPREIPE